MGALGEVHDARVSVRDLERARKALDDLTMEVALRPSPSPAGAVRAFHEKFDLPVRDEPQVDGIPEDERDRCVSLLLEEVAELVCEMFGGGNPRQLAMGFGVALGAYLPPEEYGTGRPPQPAPLLPDTQERLFDTAVAVAGLDHASASSGPAEPRIARHAAMPASDEAGR
jgi:hypothetical protein